MSKQLRILVHTVAVLGMAGLASPLGAQGWRLASNVTLRAEATWKETFDNNVFLQNDEPSAALTNAVRPYRQSFVTSLAPRLALDWKPMPEFNLAVSYAPEVVRFHSEPSENHVVHRANLTFSGQVGIVQWEQFNALTWIDGSREGLTFGITNRAGQLVGAPAIGGIPIRDRRAALIYRNGFRALHAHGDWFFRPVAWSYVHDFQTRQRNRPGYQNYVDRNDFTVGMDVGYRALPSAFVLVGYRYGFQQEPSYPWSDIRYSNDYHRFVVGLEGKLTEWLRIVGVVGPDYRDFNPHVPRGFDDHHTRLYYDASAVVQAGNTDAITLTARQFEQPAFGAPSVYEDITWEISWRHRFSRAVAATAGFRAYGGDWLAPVRRDDWIYTSSVGVSWTPSAHLSAELSHSYDWVESRIPDTDGREFTRHLVTVAVKYAF
jgi:hypothetical protein